MRTFCLATGLVLGLTACAAPSAVPTPGPDRAPVTLDDDQVITLARFLRFEDRRTYNEAEFVTGLEGAAEEVRRRIVMAAGRIGDPRATSLLLDRLASDSSPAVRADAAFALGLLGDTSTAVLDGLEAAAPRGWIPDREEEASVVVEVLATLGRLGGDRARAAVREALLAARSLDTPRHQRVAAEALLTVWKFEDGPGNVRAAAPYLDATDPEIRWRAAYALMRGGEPSALRHLLDHTDDEDHRVRAHIARALSARAADSVELAAPAVEHLARALDDPHPHVRINAVRALAGYASLAGDVGRVPMERISGLLDDPETAVAVAAAGALGGLGPRAVPTLEAAFDDDSLPLPLRAALLEQLARLDPARGAATAHRWAGEGPTHRYFAARTLPLLPPDEGLEIAARLAADPDVRVAVAALSAVGSLATAPDSPVRHRPDARALLLSSLASSEPLRRTAATRALVGLLGRTGEEGDAGSSSEVEAEISDALLGSFRRSTGESSLRPGDREAAVVALTALRTVAADGEIRETVAERLFSGPRPSDRWVLRAAAELGDVWGGAPVAAAAEDLGFYEEVVRRYVAPPLAGAPRRRARIDTPHGAITLELFGDEAPLTVHNFVTLAEAGFFDTGVWHRVIPNFVLQDGAAGGQESGGPGWSIRDEINRFRYDRGTMGMALSGPDTGGSQWFITHSPQPHLDGGYTIFGRVVDGMGAADAVLQGDPIPAIRILP